MAIRIGEHIFIQDTTERARIRIYSSWHVCTENKNMFTQCVP